MATIKSTYDAAELALGAYSDVVHGSTSTATNLSALQRDGELMSTTQAARFALRYPEVIGRVSDAATGFSMTVFRDSTGGVVLAMRGTDEILNDWLSTNVDITTLGAAYRQIISMYNAWQRLTHVQGAPVIAYKISGSDPVGSLVAEEVVNDLGTPSAPLVAPSQPVYATGHSLGGHLAIAFAALFRDNTIEVHAFNSPGFVNSVRNQSFFNALGGFLPIGETPGGVPVTNIIADGTPGPSQSLSAVAGLHSRPGVPLDIAIENQAPPTDEPNPASPGMNHSQRVLTDSLAVLQLLTQLAPSLSTNSFAALMDSAALGTAGGLEKIVDALSLIVGMDVAPLPVGNTHREALYQGIYELQSNAVYSMLSGDAALHVLAERDAATLAAESKQDFGHFLALSHILPLAIEDAVGLLASVHPDLYEKWSADRSKRMTGATNLEFSDSYISDRAAFLSWRGTANTLDTTTILDPAFVAGQRLRYSELVSGVTVTVSDAVLPPDDDTTKRFMFGGSGSDALIGGSLADRLYAGKGADLLQGGRGNDYLEGGAGMDTYVYRAETSYIWPDWNDGEDEIRDTDGQGIIRYTFTGSGTSGTTSHLIGGEALEIDETHWRSTDGKFNYERKGADLRVRIIGDAGGSILIRDFDFESAAQDGYLGIRLVGQLAAPSGSIQFEGDRRILGSYYFTDPETGVSEWRLPEVILYDEYGNALRDLGLVLENANDTFHGTPLNDTMYGRGGGDTLFGDDGDDVLYGGDGNDHIEGGGGDDVISGNDVVSRAAPPHGTLSGGDGNDQIFAGPVQPLEEVWQAINEDTPGEMQIGASIDGGAGNDVLVGSVFADHITGGSGDDLIIAGAGYDRLDGDEGDDIVQAGVGGAHMYGGLGSDLLLADEDPVAGSSLFGGTDDYAPGDGDDILIGSANGNNYFEGGDGSDLVFGGSGNDWFSDGLFAYFAPDILYMGEGNDNVFGSHGHDLIFGEAGDDQLNGNGGDDEIYGGAGNDRLYGGSSGIAFASSRFSSSPAYVEVEPGDDRLYGEEGDDYLDGNEGDDSLFGGAGDDVLSGGLGHDFLDGGPGKDRLEGWSGGDVYVINRDDGIDTILDIEGESPEGDTIIFGDGIAPEDVTPLRSSADIGLFILIADSDSRIDIPLWYSNDGDGTALGKIETFMFADGGAWSTAEIESRVVVATGPTPARDRLTGTSGDDVIHALGGADDITDAAGNDILFGDEQNDRIADSAGHNLLVGGAGNDLIQLSGGAPGSVAIGGRGSDRVVIDDHSVVAYNAGDGEDVIHWVAGDVSLLTISLGRGYKVDDITILQNDFGVWINFGPEIPPNEDGDPAPQEAIALPNLLETSEAWPALILQVIDDEIRTYDLNEVVEAFHADLAQDPDLARWAGGDALRASLLGVSTTHAMGGAIAHQYATTGTVDGLTADQIRAVLMSADLGVSPQPISIPSGNSAPEVVSLLADQSANEDAAFSYVVSADAFADPDAGDALTYVATLEDGSALPAWLSFDPETRTFSGTPLQADVGSLDVTVTATDPGGLSAADAFTLSVANVNDAPVRASPLADQSFEAGTGFSFGVPEGTFADEDPGDTLALSASRYDGSALPAWLAFDHATALFTGSPTLADIGISHILVTATDTAGAAAHSDFALVVHVPAGMEATGSAGDDVLYGGAGDETLTAKGGSDYLYGDLGNDLLKGGGGNDVLQGGAGNDVLRGGKGQNVLDGGAGDDLIFGGQGSAFIMGGAGNDTLRVGRGSDVIAFNAGDGMDTIYGGRDGGNTLSFGGGIRYSDLTLSKSGKDLVVSTGAGEGVTLKNWYAGNHSVLNLQIVLDATEEFDAASADPLYNRRVQSFDFLGMVSAFDAARAATPGLTSWEMTNALLAFHLSGADDMALGGDLAYWYGKNRTLAGMSLQSAQQVIGASNFGSEAQSLRPFSGLQEGFVKLA